MDAPPVSQPSQRAECQVDQVSLDELMKRDPLFSAADIESTVKQWVIGFESAWCAGDMAPWQWQIGDQLLENYRAQLAMMKQNGEVSVSRDLAVLECAVERWEEDGPQEYLDVWLRVKKKTYKVAASDPDRIVAGNPHTIYHIDYRWQLVRGVGMKTLPEDRREVRCENCGAPIPIDAHLTACEYCKTELDPKSYDWVLGKVEKLAQRNL